MAYASELKSNLKDVVLDGAKILSKKKLLWLLGWGQDRARAWSELLDLWEELGERRETLMGTEVGDKIVLTISPRNDACRHQPVSSWAGG